jgi:hypothetical protein
MSNKKLAAILIVGDIRARGQRSLDLLYEQSIPSEMEIIVLDLSTPGTPILSTSDRIFTIYRSFPGMSWSVARAKAIEYSSAPIIAFIEDHAFTAPSWAEALVRAYQGPWAAVGYAFECSNPATYIARGVLLAEYGRWQVPAVSGEAEILPCGNVSYKRDILLQLGDELAGLLTPDFALHERFKQLGLRMYIASDAIVAHQSFVQIRNLAGASAVFCRLLAHHRAKTQMWNWGKRLLFALVTPLVSPPISFIRLMASAHRRQAGMGQLIFYLPILLLKSISSAAGEALGYLSRGENTDQQFSVLELNTPREQQE